VEWETRTSIVPPRDPEKPPEVYEGVEVPKFWSQAATDIVAGKYFRKAGVPDERGGVNGRETSVRQTYGRIASFARNRGEWRGYFETPEDAQIFEDELKDALIHQRALFNSPVEFNGGLDQHGIKGEPSGNWYWDDDKKEVVAASDSYTHPPLSACYIQPVMDDLTNPGGLMDLWLKEARLFKFGSGTGTNFSVVRAEGEPLSGGGKSSGLMSFLKVGDRSAGSIKSGGTTRRAAKMVCLDVDHPEIDKFIDWKYEGERIVRDLVKKCGYSPDFEEKAYQTVSGQNSNNSIRVTNSFMEGIDDPNATFETSWRTDPSVTETRNTKEVMDKIVEAAWECADPALQFDTTIQEWHTCPNDGRINASNPCSEYMFLDDTACNLSSMNLVQFEQKDAEGNISFDIMKFLHTVRLLHATKEIFVGAASYPSPEMARNSHTYRTTGIGFANMGAFLMRQGIPYDSEKARSIIGSISALMTGEAYAQSARIAAIKHIGPFEAFERNREPMMRVIGKHEAAVDNIPQTGTLENTLIAEAKRVWANAKRLGEEHGYRNAQVSVLAPTGTIGLAMDCDTTGIEPDYALVKYKKLAGGGHMKIVNRSLPVALTRRGYSSEEIGGIVDYVVGVGTGRLEEVDGIKREHLDELNRALSEEKTELGREKVLFGTEYFVEDEEEMNGKLTALGYSKKQIAEIRLQVTGMGTVEGAPHLKEEHYAIFDTADKSGVGTRTISTSGHIGAVAAAQPFISGAISKTINMPHEATKDDVRAAYTESWNKGAKSISIYRDGCKMCQPLNTDRGRAESLEELAEIEHLEWGQKRTGPNPMDGIKYKLDIGGQRVNIRTGEYEDGSFAEAWIDIFKQGTGYNEMTNAFAIALSKGLQHGWPLPDIVRTFSGRKAEPNGIVRGHPYIKTASSISDLVARVLGLEYLGMTEFASGDIKVDENNLRFMKNRRIRAALAAYEGNGKGAEVMSEGNGEEAAREHARKRIGTQMSGEICNCGGMLIRSGTCKVCTACGTTTGCS